MKLIPLTQGKFVQVDDWNYDKLMEHKWFAHKDKNTYYAQRQIKINKNKQKTISMHNIIMHTPIGQEVDHIDGDGLNCLEENMRNCTHANNCMNRKYGGTSKYTGVSKYRGNKFQAQISNKGKKIFLGYHNNEEDAARAYDKAAKKYFGEFAHLNFPNE
jgi:hypothetical protein